MALQSAQEDFETRTLGAIPGKLGKLHYLAQLHDGSGSYAHWGMGRVHGEETARRAMRAAHQAILAEILRTPLRRLAEDLDWSASNANLSTRELIGSLERLTPRALPYRTVTDAAQKHLRVVLHALSSLLESPALATRRGASPLPPPAR